MSEFTKQYFIYLKFSGKLILIYKKFEQWF